METATRPSPLMNPRYPLAPMASPAKCDVGKVEKRWKMAELFADREVQQGDPRVPRGQKGSGGDGRASRGRNRSALGASVSASCAGGRAGFIRFTFLRLIFLIVGAASDRLVARPALSQIRLYASKQDGTPALPTPSSLSGISSPKAAGGSPLPPLITEPEHCRIQNDEIKKKKNT